MLAAYCFHHLEDVTKEDLMKLDLINLAFGLIKEGLLCYPDQEEAVHYIRQWKNIKPEFKVVLSVGGWGAGGFSTMCLTSEGIEAFTASCMKMIDALGLDGLDIDWEYPTSYQAGIDAAPEDCQNFTALLRSLRTAMDAKYEEHKLLTIAVSGKIMKESMEFEKLPALLDYVSLMTYDLAYGPVAKHHTALNPTKANPACVKSAVKEYTEAGIPKEKLIIGAAFYSRCWENIISEDPTGLGGCLPDPEKPGGFGKRYSEIVEECLDENGRGKNGWISYRDNGAPYLYHPETKTFLSYDDEQSVRDKVGYLHEEGLAGIMYWEHSNDPKRILLTALWEENQKY